VHRRPSTRWAFVAAVAALAACVVSPIATTASYTIVPGGSSLVVTVTPAGTTSTASFAGTAGHRISLNFSHVTITSSRVSILKPNGTNLLTPFAVHRYGRFLDVRTLPVTGTYKIVVNPRSTYTGRMTLRLYDVPADPAPAAVTAGGAGVTVTTTTPGQNASLTFNGTAAQRVSVNLTGVGYTSAKLRIVSPDGTDLYTPALNFGRGGNFLEPKVLPATGAYTIKVDPWLLAVGSATVQLYDVPADPSATITACPAEPCSATVSTTTTPGQNATLTFSGTTGQRVSILAGNSNHAFPVQLSILKPDSTPLFSPAVGVGAGGLDTFVDTKTLPTTGTYTVLLNPLFADYGSLDVRLYTVPADQTGTITPGTPLTATTTMPGQNALFTFPGTLNQRVSLNLTNMTFATAKVSIIKPGGGLLFSPALSVSGAGAFLEPKTLPASGTYTLVVDPQSNTTGSLDLTLATVPADPSTTIASNGTPVTVTTTAGGQNARLTFSGTINQRVTLQMSAVTMNSASVTIYKPDGQKLVPTKTVGPAGAYVDTTTLPATGTYKIVVDPQGPATGSMTLTLKLVPADATATSGALTANGTSASVNITAPGQNGRISFAGTANGRLAFTLVSFGSAYCDAKISVLKPDNTTLIASTCGANGKFFAPKTLPVTGSYKLVVDPQGSNTGTANLTLYAVPPDLVTGLGPSVSLTPGQNAYLSFTANGGQTVTVTPQTGGTIEMAQAQLVKSDKTTEVGGSEFWSPTTGDPLSVILPGTGTATYYLRFDPIAEASGTSMSFSLS
jgi:hypothetical protein